MLASCAETNCQKTGHGVAARSTENTSSPQRLVPGSLSTPSAREAPARPNATAPSIGAAAQRSRRAAR